MIDQGAEYNYLFKILLIGNSAVGKSCLLLRYTDDIFNENYISTIGVDFKIKTVTHRDSVIKLQIWDTAGQERFKTITGSYYKGAHGIMVVYDVTDRESFQAVEGWLAEVEKRAAKDVVKVLIGNKADLAGDRKVSYEEGLEMAKQWGMKFLETSAKSGTNVQQCFQMLTEEVDQKVLQPGKEKTKGQVAKKGVSLTDSPITSSTAGWCC
eukprot:TRINITY_DN707_c0_g2_i3.p1 TRINITY_DN707_c0_g2~~TRINITY_DN707_c0_g2_i3.p1  ORF type:complete len:210 (-),score=53.95 TRINITY_DN707_c0_g2_i3:149-778(-)